MEAKIVQAQYEQLATIAAKFRSQQESMQSLTKTVQQASQALRQNGWKGRGEAAFFNELDSALMPALERCGQALQVGDAAIRTISQILQTAEEQAAKLFRDDAEAAANGGKPGLAAPLENGSAQGWASPPKALSDKEIFNDKYMDRLVGSKFPGADSDELNDAMETLLEDPTPSQEARALAQIVEATGMTKEEVQAQYQQFKKLRAEALIIGKNNGEEPPTEINHFLHPKFLGSTSSLRFGKVVGDRLGLAPVFGAMLSPTGGLVGSGNTAIDLHEKPLAYHGIVHDAAGYLITYHNVGPGYDYLGREDRSTRSPYTGQASGIRYWNDKLGRGTDMERVSELGGSAIGVYEDIKTIPTKIKEVYNQTADKIERTAKGTMDWFSDTFGL